MLDMACEKDRTGLFIYIRSLISLTSQEAMNMQNEKICSSCGIRLTGKGITFFPCPNCGQNEIGRCYNCRDQSVKYICPKCGFSGP